MPPPWRPSRPGWMGLWAAWSRGRCPYLQQGGSNEMISEVPSKPNHSVIIWNTVIIIFQLTNVGFIFQTKWKKNKTTVKIVWHFVYVLVYSYVYVVSLERRKRKYKNLASVSVALDNIIILFVLHYASLIPLILVRISCLIKTEWLLFWNVH